MPRGRLPRQRRSFGVRYAVVSNVADRVAAGQVAKREPSADQRAAFLADVRSGTDPSTAARKLDGPAGMPRTSSQFNRLARRDADFAADYSAALDERKAVMADRVDDLVARRAEERDAPAALVLGFAARWNHEFRWRERSEPGAGESPLELSRPQIDVSLLTDSQVERLDAILREAELLIAIGQGRAANPERAALPAGEVEAA